MLDPNPHPFLGGPLPGQNSLVWLASSTVDGAFRFHGTSCPRESQQHALPESSLLESRPLYDSFPPPKLGIENNPVKEVQRCSGTVAWALRQLTTACSFGQGSSPPSQTSPRVSVSVQEAASGWAKTLSDRPKMATARNVRGPQGWRPCAFGFA